MSFKRGRWYLVNVPHIDHDNPHAITDAFSANLSACRQACSFGPRQDILSLAVFAFVFLSQWSLPYQ